MDPKVKELLSRARSSGVTYGKAAGKFAGNVVEQAKLNLQIFDLNTDIDVAYKEIGKLVYAVHVGEEVCNEAVQAQIELIDSKTAQIAEIRAKLSGIKEEMPVCESCGQVVETGAEAVEDAEESEAAAEPAEAAPCCAEGGECCCEDNEACDCTGCTEEKKPE